MNIRQTANHPSGRRSGPEGTADLWPVLLVGAGIARHAPKRELRLIWGTLGVLLTVLTVVFGFLFAA